MPQDIWNQLMQIHPSLGLLGESLKSKTDSLPCFACTMGQLLCPRLEPLAMQTVQVLKVENRSQRNYLQLVILKQLMTMNDCKFRPALACLEALLWVWGESLKGPTIPHLRSLSHGGCMTTSHLSRLSTAVSYSLGHVHIPQSPGCSLLQGIKGTGN